MKLPPGVGLKKITPNRRANLCKGIKNRSGGGFGELYSMCGSLGRVSGFPLNLAGLLTTLALDLDLLDCSSHRGLRSIIDSAYSLPVNCSRADGRKLL
jgi:hypothetical protein